MEPASGSSCPLDRRATSSPSLKKKSLRKKSRRSNWQKSVNSEVFRALTSPAQPQRLALLAAGQRGQQDHQGRDPQAHPDQKVFGAGHLSSIHGEPPFPNAVAARDSATVGPSVSAFLLSIACKGTGKANVCQKIPAWVYWRTQPKRLIFGFRTLDFSGGRGISQNLAQLGGKDLHGKGLMHQHGPRFEHAVRRQ
jgi:hypothetical protein